MSTNIFFPADRLEALTTVLKEYGKQNDMFGEDCTLSDMLYQFGVETYTNRGTGDLVVDRLGDYADLHLVTRKAIAVLTDLFSPPMMTCRSWSSSMMTPAPL